MEYKITDNMLNDLLRHYIERISSLEKKYQVSPLHLNDLFNSHIKLKDLKEQIKEHGKNPDEIIDPIKKEFGVFHNYDHLDVYVDGGARNNNDNDIANESACAFAIFHNKELIYKQAIYLGSEVKTPYDYDNPENERMNVTATNNVAEYSALLYAAQYILKTGYIVKHVTFYSDSTSVTLQMNHQGSARSPHLLAFRNHILHLCHSFNSYTIQHIPREKNDFADKLVNEVLDSEKETDKACEL